MATQTISSKRPVGRPRKDAAPPAPPAATKPGKPAAPGIAHKAGQLAGRLAASIAPPAATKPGLAKPGETSGHPALVTPSPSPMTQPSTKAAEYEANRAKLAEALAALETQKTQIAELQAAAARAKTPARTTRTREEIVDGLTPPADDWRAPYHGARVKLRHVVGVGKGDQAHFEIVEGRPDLIALLAIPRDNDVAGEGPVARAQGLIASHVFPSEDGATYAGAPLYLTMGELGEAWIDVIED